jgi:hypothetical protein
LRPEWFRMKTTFRDWPLFSYTRPGRLYCNCAGYNLTPFFGVGTCSPILGHGHLVDNRPFSRCNLQSSIWKCLFPVSTCDFFAETPVCRFELFSTPSDGPAGGLMGLPGQEIRWVARGKPGRTARTGSPRVKRSGLRSSAGSCGGLRGVRWMGDQGEGRFRARARWFYVRRGEAPSLISSSPAPRPQTPYPPAWSSPAPRR